MADHIPFVYTDRDCQVLRRFYPDSVAVRLSLQSVSEIASNVPAGLLRWIDPGIDGLHKWPKVTDNYKNYLKTFPGFEQIGDPNFQRKPNKTVVDGFVTAALDACKLFAPDWLSVPLLPLVGDSSRNKVNRQLAESAKKWKFERNFTGKLILPVIFTHQTQIKGKTERARQLRLVEQCYQRSGADGIWVVESSLSDQEGSQPLERRFKAVIDFQQELLQNIPRDTILMGGPYWGLNLILWARTVVRYPAIGLGSAYQYYLPGGVQMRAKKRVAIPPIRRWAVASPGLQSWLRRALKQLPQDDNAHTQIAEIERNFDQLRIAGRAQVARFYKEWFDSLSTVPAAGRALALYQDLSSAYVVGTSLPDLPPDEGAGRRPYRVAKQLMVNCL